MSDPSVLIVDDERRLRELLGRSVERMGFAVHAVGSAEEAATWMKQTPCDIVLLDLNLPGKSGVDFMDDLLRHWPKTKVIVLTGFGDLDSAQKAIRHKLADYVTKPFDLSDIERALDRARRQMGMASKESPEPLPNQVDGLVGSLAVMERQMILEAIHRHKGNRTAAAEELGITRRTLYNKIEQYHLHDEV